MNTTSVRLLRMFAGDGRMTFVFVKTNGDLLRTWGNLN